MKSNDKTAVWIRLIDMMVERVVIKWIEHGVWMAVIAVLVLALNKAFTGT